MTEDLVAKLQEIDDKLDRILMLLEGHLAILKNVAVIPVRAESRQKENVNVFLFSLPESLRRTLSAITRLRVATSKDVARLTGRSRSVENIHLNQLERMGYLEKFRKGRKVYFKIPNFEEV